MMSLKCLIAPESKDVLKIDAMLRSQSDKKATNFWTTKLSSVGFYTFIWEAQRDSFPKCLQQPGLSRVEGRGWELYVSLPHGWKEPKCLTGHLCLLGTTWSVSWSQEPGRHWSQAQTSRCNSQDKCLSIPTCNWIAKLMQTIDNLPCRIPNNWCR